MYVVSVGFNELYSLECHQVLPSQFWLEKYNQLLYVIQLQECRMKYPLGVI